MLTLSKLVMELATSSQNFGSEEERRNFAVEFYLKCMKCSIVSKNSFEFTEGVRA
jgi:hypothetical protein